MIEGQRQLREIFPIGTEVTVDIQERRHPSEPWRLVSSLLSGVVMTTPGLEPGQRTNPGMIAVLPNQPLQFGVYQYSYPVPCSELPLSVPNEAGEQVERRLYVSPAETIPEQR